MNEKQWFYPEQDPRMRRIKLKESAVYGPGIMETVIETERNLSDMPEQVDMSFLNDISDIEGRVSDLEGTWRR